LWSASRLQTSELQQEAADHKGRPHIEKTRVSVAHPTTRKELGQAMLALIQQALV
jgi:hypothetical protein